MTDSEFEREQMLAVVNASPAAVAAHDKAAWLGLFSSEAVVEDPVGSLPHRRTPKFREMGKDPLDPFYETFIAPNSIHFEVDRDVICGRHVMRDLTIVIRMSASVLVRVPVHLLYELTEEAGALKIDRLAAHWELLPMLQQQLRSGLGFAVVGVSSALRMLRHLGLGGMAGFARAAKSVGAAGRNRAQAIVSDFNSSDIARLEAYTQSAATVLNFPLPGVSQVNPGLESMSVTEWVNLPGSIVLDKVMAAGAVVSATMTYNTADTQWQGVALFELERSDLSLQRLHCYLQPAST